MEIRGWPSPQRSTGTRSPALVLRCEEGRGSFEQVALLLQPGVLAPQRPELLQLAECGRHAASAPASRRNSGGYAGRVFGTLDTFLARPVGASRQVSGLAGELHPTRRA